MKLICTLVAALIATASITAHAAQDGVMAYYDDDDGRTLVYHEACPARASDNMTAWWRAVLIAPIAERKDDVPGCVGFPRLQRGNLPDVMTFCPMKHTLFGKPELADKYHCVETPGNAPFHIEEHSRG